MCIETKSASEIQRLVMRGFLNGALIYQSEMQVTEQELETVAFMLALEHLEQFANGQINMMEFHFPDDGEGDYLRIGTDPTGMVRPVKIDL